MRARINAAAVVSALALAGCTHSGEIYDRTKHTKQDFSAKNTTAAVVGTAAAVALIVLAAKSGGGGYGGGYSGGSYDYDWAWDYRSANGQWACRGRQTGQYAYPSNCRYDPVNDYTWPG